MRLIAQASVVREGRSLRLAVWVAIVIVGLTDFGYVAFSFAVLASQVAAAVFAGAVVIAGFEVTERLIICPAQATSP